MFTAEELALIDAIHDDPKNDSPRLAYADWLADHEAAEYAEFIRLQCEQPYVTIATRDTPRVSTTYRFPWDDAAAEKRLKRLLDLYPILLDTERFAQYRQDYYYQEFRRGLAIWEIEDIDLSPEGRVGIPSSETRGTIACPQLLRFRLTLNIPAESLISSIAHPSMRLVDYLRIHIERHHEAIGIDSSVDTRSLNFSFLQGLEAIDLSEMPGGMAGIISGKARVAGVIVSDDY